MNDREREALDHLLTYNWNDESADYCDQVTEDPEGAKRHIFHEMHILRTYLNRHGLVESEDGS